LTISTLIANISLTDRHNENLKTEKYLINYHSIPYWAKKIGELGPLTKKL